MQMKNKDKLRLQECIRLVKSDWHNISTVPEEYKTIKLCMIAVKQNGWALRFITKPNRHIYLAAVKNRGEVLLLIENQTNSICLAAVKRNGYALQYVKNQTPKIIQAALEQNIKAGKYINQERFPEIYEKWQWMVH